MNFPSFLRIAHLPDLQFVAVNEPEAIQKELFANQDTALVKIISEKLRFSYETVTPMDGQWGNVLPDGNWSGMVGLLLQNEADLIISMISVTGERNGIIDFSFPYVVDFYTFATRRLEKSTGKHAFLKPFTTQVWIYLCAVALLLPALHSTLFGRKQLRSHFLRAFRSFLQGSPASAPESVGEYFLTNSWLIFRVLLRWCYAAVLLASLTFPSLTGVRNIPELATAFRQGEFQCTAYPGTYIANSLLNSADADMRALGKCVKENKGHPNFDVALTESKPPIRLAYIGLASKFMTAKARYFVSEDVFFPDYRGNGIQKDFCCKAQLDTIVHNIWSSGIYSKITKDYLRKKTRSKALWNPINEENKQTHLSVADLEGIFALWVLGCFLAVVVFLFELVRGRKRR